MELLSLNANEEEGDVIASVDLSIEELIGILNTIYFNINKITIINN